MSKPVALAAALSLAGLIANPAWAQPGGGHREFAGRAPVSIAGRDHHHGFHRERRFDHRRAVFLGWPYDWGDQEPTDAYPPEDAGPPPPYPALAQSQPATQPSCALLLHWDEKTGSATREHLCD